MGDVKVTWNGSDIIDLSASGSKTIKTGGKYNAYDMTLQYTKPAGSSDFVVTLTRNLSGEWEPDCTYADALAAYNAGKTIVAVTNDNSGKTWCEWNSGSSSLDIEVAVYDENLDRTECQYGYLQYDGFHPDSRWYEYYPWDADAVAANVANGKVFYTSTGRDVGTYTPPSPSYQTKSVDPSLSAQSITPSAGYDALAQVNISAITSALLATLDADFVAGNIKKDVDLFGLTGTYEGGGGGDLKIFDKLAIDTITFASNYTGSGTSVSHSLGEVPDFVIVWRKTGGVASDGVNSVQLLFYTKQAYAIPSGVTTDTTLNYPAMTSLTLNRYGGNGVYSSSFNKQRSANYGISNLTSTTVDVGISQNSGQRIDAGDYWLLTGKLKSTYRVVP